MVQELAKFNDQDYLVDDSIWTKLTNETARLNNILDETGKLTPDDVKTARKLAKTVTDYGILYRRAVTKRAKEYKELLNTRLQEIGYDKIESYVDMQKALVRKAQNDRLTTKLDQFNKLVEKNLEKYPLIKQSSFSYLVANNIGHRFPDVNSAAKNREIKDWNIINTIISKSLSDVNNVLSEKPILIKLPASSNTINLLLMYLKTGNVDYLSDQQLMNALKSDRTTVENIAIQTKFKTDDQIYAQINNLLEHKNHDTLENIYRLLSIYLNK